MPEPKKRKSKKSVAKSLTTDFDYITAENAKTENNRKIKPVEKIILTKLIDFGPVFRV